MRLDCISLNETSDIWSTTMFWIVMSENKKWIIIVVLFPRSYFSVKTLKLYIVYIKWISMEKVSDIECNIVLIESIMFILYRFHCKCCRITLASSFGGILIVTINMVICGKSNQLKTPTISSYKFIYKRNFSVLANYISGFFFLISSVEHENDHPEKWRPNSINNNNYGWECLNQVESVNEQL